MKLLKLTFKNHNNLETYVPKDEFNRGGSYYMRDLNGWFKPTKNIDVDDIIPDKWDKTTSWFEIAKLTYKYGLEVGEYLADGKTAGIIARQTARSKAFIYKKIKDIIPNINNFNLDFFDCLSTVYYLSCFGLDTFDIVQTDDNLSKLDFEYNCHNSIYKDLNNISMKEYILLKYGQDYVNIIDCLIKE